MKIAIGSDHAGFSTKEKIKDFLKNTYSSYEILDIGTYDGTEIAVDYPIFGKKVADLVSKAEADFGIVICGSGIGITMAAQKVENVRAFTARNENDAILARQHNNANIIGFGERISSFDEIKIILVAFFETKFDNVERHKRRVSQIK